MSILTTDKLSKLAERLSQLANCEANELADVMNEAAAVLAKLAQQEPVMIQHKKPIEDGSGELIGFSDWQDKSGLPWWPHRSLYAAPEAPKAD